MIGVSVSQPLLLLPRFAEGETVTRLGHYGRGSGQLCRPRVYPAVRVLDSSRRSPLGHVWDGDPSNPALAPTTAGGPITMSSCGKHKHATEHDGSTLRLSRIAPDPHIDLFGNKLSILVMGIE
jgi:hypothetical protein